MSLRSHKNISPSTPLERFLVANAETVDVQTDANGQPHSYIASFADIGGLNFALDTSAADALAHIEEKRIEFTKKK